MASKDEYDLLVQKMVKAGRAWMDAQPGPDLHLAFRAFSKPTTGNLDEDVIRIYGMNEPSRELLRAMDEATNHQATLLMAQLAVKILCAGPDVVNLHIYPTKQSS